jgi:hypothetical protein
MATVVDEDDDAAWLEEELASTPRALPASTPVVAVFSEAVFPDSPDKTFAPELPPPPCGFSMSL